MHSDGILDAVGGMSRFQLLVLMLLRGPRIVLAWGMLMMSFAGVAPDMWQCDVNSDVITSNTTSLNTCPTQNDTCMFVYSQDKHTVIDEWDLLCERKHIKNLIIAVQMGGVLLGCILAGQSADGIGRKKTFIISLILHAGFNLVAAFSITWQMFAVLRFLIGAMVGASLAVNFPYCMEFIGREWRPIAIVIPTWQIGGCLLALAAWLRPNWSDLHIIVAIMHLPFFLGFFFVPESLRWLAVHGHLKKAERVVDLIARYNGRKKPANTAKILKELAEEEENCRRSDQNYTYLDIYRTWNICWKSLVIEFVWMCMSFVFYGISFGVGKLHGNLYLNIFLMAVVGIPGSTVVYIVSNRLGRRWTTFTCFAIATVSAFGVVIASRLVSGGRGHWTTAFALACKLGVSAAWSGFAIITSETYPTPIRNLGYGAASGAARIGGIMSPYVFAVGDYDLLPLFAIVGSLMFVCGCLCLLLPETMGTPLEDTTKHIAVNKNKAATDIQIATVSDTVSKL